MKRRESGVRISAAAAQMGACTSTCTDVDLASIEVECLWWCVLCSFSLVLAIIWARIAKKSVKDWWRGYYEQKELKTIVKDWLRCQWWRYRDAAISSAHCWLVLSMTMTISQKWRGDVNKADIFCLLTASVSAEPECSYVSMFMCHIIIFMPRSHSS